VTRAPLLATTVLVLAAAGCGGGGNTSAVATTTVTKTLTTTNPTGTASGVTVTTHGRFHYPAAVTENYMRSCMKSNVTQAYCACTLDKLSNNVSTADFARIGLSGGRIPTRIRKLITRAAAACADKL
jgi:galactitol-specific phosphotransferase system IIB component